MSIKLNLDDIKQLIIEAVETVSNVLNGLISKNTSRDTKRATLLSYWLKDYCKYINDEDSFDSTSLIRYKRGNVVQVEFGYRIGRELGGRHYAVVIDNKNDIHSDVITVIPLSSLKPSYKENRFTFELETGLYKLYTHKVNERIQHIQNKIDNSDAFVKLKFEECSEGKISIDEYKHYLAKSAKQNNEFRIQLARLHKQVNTILKLKEGTIINVGQIVTISKMRIVNPQMNTDSLYGIKLCDNDLNKLNSKLKSLYIH